MGGGQKDFPSCPPSLYPKPISSDMGEQEIKMWGKGGVQQSEPLEVPRCIFFFFFFFFFFTLKCYFYITF